MFRGRNWAQRATCKRSAKRRRKLLLEALEDRRVLATLFWQGDLSSSWSAAANWNTAQDGTGADQAPQAANADVLVFDTNTPGVANFANNNDLVGLTDIAIQIVDDDANTFNLSGNSIALAANGITLTTTAGGATVSTPLTLVAPTSVTVNDNGIPAAGQLMLGGAINTAGQLLTFGGNDASGTHVSGPISGAGGVTVNSRADFTSANSYSGVTTINGLFRFTQDGALGTAAGNTIVGTGGRFVQDGGFAYTTAEPVTMDGGNLESSNGTNTFAGPITLNAANTSIVTVNSDYTLTGPITGVGGFTKFGAGVLTLDGVNSYAATANVDAGTLLVNVSTAAASTVNVNSGGTLGGNGNVQGPVNVNSGGTLSPGVSPGILTTGNLDLLAGSTLTVEIDSDGGTTPATPGAPNFDQVQVAGTVTLAGNLNVVETFTPAPGQSFLIIDNDSTDPVNGTFAGLPEGAVVDSNFNGSGLAVRITYVGGSGNDVVLLVASSTVITADSNPAPSSASNDGFPDFFRIVQNGANIEVYVNGALVFSEPELTISNLTIAGSTDNDQLTVDTSGGLVEVPQAIRFLGDVGFDTLTIDGSGGQQAFTVETVSPASQPGDGRHTLTDGVQTQVVDFFGLEPITTNVAVANFNVSATPGLASLLQDDNQINYEPGLIMGPTWGRVTVDNFEPIEFINKTVLTIDAGAGSDEINLNNPNTPTGLGMGLAAGTPAIVVNGQDPTASDKLVANAIPGSLDGLILRPTSQGAGRIVDFLGVAPLVGYSGIEELALVSQSADADLVQIGGTAGTDTFEYTPGATLGEGSIRGTMDIANLTGSGPFTLPAVTFSGVFVGTPGGGAPVTIPFQGSVGINDDPGTQDAAGASDTVIINGTSENDVFQIIDDRVFLNTRGEDPLATPFPAPLGIGNTLGAFPTGGTSTARIIVNAASGDDRIDLLGAQSPTISYDFNGGNPDTGSDVLNLVDPVAAGQVAGPVVQSVTIRPDPLDSSQQDVLGYSASTLPIDVRGIELIRYRGGGADDSLTVEPGAGDNQVRVEAAQPAAWDLVRGDSLPNVEFSGLNAFTVNANAAGSDEVTFATWFLTGAAPANYSANLDGTDTLVVAGVDGSRNDGAANDRFTITNPAGGPVAVTDNKGTTGGTPVTVTATNAATGRLQINTLGGDDVVTIDVEQSAPSSSDVIGVPITFDGGSGSDLLEVTGNPATAVDEVIYRPGPAITEGRLRYEDATDARLMTIDFVNLEPVNDFLAAANLTVDGTDEENDITYQQGSAADRGRVTVDGFELIEFQNKTNLNVNGLNGGDTIVLDNGALPTGLQTITVSGNNGDDAISVIALPDAGATTFVSATLSGNDGNDRVDAGNLAVDTPLTINGGLGADTLIGGRGNDTINGGGGDDTMIGGDPAITPAIGNNTYDGGAGYDTIGILGTPAGDTIDVNQTAAGTLTSTINGNASNETFSNTEAARIEGGSSNDGIRLTIDDSLFAAAADPDTQVLAYTVLGGDTGTGDRLNVIDDGAGDTIIHRLSRVVDSGTISIAPAHPGGAAPPISYEGVERIDVTPINNITAGTGTTDSAGRLFVFKADPFESNDQLPNATYLGSGATINVDPTIDPGPGPLGAPADQDWYRFVAETTGTLDVQVYFQSQGTLANGRSGLPGNGNLDLAAFDAAGNLIAGTGSFGSNESAATDADERIRIPVVAGQTYYLQVAGAAPAEGQPDAVNVYNLTAVNEAPPVPYDLELNDIIQVGSVNNAVAATTSTFSATLAPANPALNPPTVQNDFAGKTVEFTTGANAGRRARITTFAAGTFTVGAGLVAAPAVGDAFIIEATDTGRSQLDNVSRDNTPVVIFRLDDDRLLLDVSGNVVNANPPDQQIPIPFNAEQVLTPTVAGYRVPVFIEGNPQQPGTAPQTPIGYARQLPGTLGVYVFDFGVDAVQTVAGTDAGLTLTDGSHFISAKVEITDPAQATITDFAARSASLEIVVDTGISPIAFGETTIAGDGLHPDSDSGVADDPSTRRDRITNDTTPTLWGAAEANSIVRVYADVNQDGVVDPGDILLGKTVAAPLDGTNQFPGGQWQLTSTVDLNDPGLFPARDRLRQLLVTSEDDAGNVNLPNDEAGAGSDPQQVLRIFLDTQGPQVFDPDGAGPQHAVRITDNPQTARNESLYDLFDPKPSVDGPTPPVTSLTISVRDLPAREAPDFLYRALAGGVAADVGHYQVVGDHSGQIAIGSVTFTPAPDPPADDTQAAGTLTLTFNAPLPDDRFTLTIADDLVDPAGNALDGETNTSQPQETPVFPTGDGVAGGDFVARFTVDSRPELATFCCTGVYVDINGNFVFDPEGQDNDFTNRDLVFKFGQTSDAIFAGDFAASGAASASGFDKLGSYGLTGGSYQFQLDLQSHDGVADFTSVSAFQINAIPVAGDFSAAHPGDEIGLFDGQRWYLDSDGDNVLEATDTVIVSNLRGLPIVGDFNGDGSDDLATFDVGLNRFSFDLDRNGTVDDTLSFGFPGLVEKPVAGDLNLDGIDDLGLWVPGRRGQGPSETAEWFLLISDQAGNLPSNVFNAFSPAPLGNDLFAQFGDESALPLLANFDPPLVSISTPVTPSVSVDPFDVNGDGRVTTRDALDVINALNSADLTGLSAEALAKLDTNGDGVLGPLDALGVINRVNAELAAAEGEAPVAVSPDPRSGGFQPPSSRTATVHKRSGGDAPRSGGFQPPSSLAATMHKPSSADAPRSGGFQPPSSPTAAVRQPSGAGLLALLDDLDQLETLESLFDTIADDVTKQWNRR